MKGSSLGVRKGAWTEEEDVLLKSCVQKYGEGKWHLVPLKAGLNRCRKSCRLRWLNYLRPNIKRDEFSFDEVDLIIRLHKLLGNRWELISGRLPGRTSNDVKNYWNNKLCKKMISQSEEVKKYETQKKSSESTIIKPRRVLFSGNSSLVNVQAHNKSVESQNNPSKPSPPSLVLPQEDNAIEPWWESLFVENIGDNKTATPPINWPEDVHILESLWGEEVQTAWASKVGQGGVFCVEDGQSFWNCESSISIDVNLWK